MINFLKFRYIALLFSITTVVAGVVTYVYKIQTRGYAFSYSVDFTGGTQILFKFSQPVTGAEVEKVLEHAGWPGAITREFSGKSDVLVRVKEVVTDSKGLAERMREAIKQQLPGIDVDVLQSESIGPGIGADLRWKSIYAVLLSMFAMLLYIAWRFWSFSFGIGAVVSLLHDAIFLLVVFLLFDLEISVNVIGAILAVLGYSMNDTIVIFSRIRSNIVKMPQTPIGTIVNVSINETLRRTLLTSLATTLTVAAMLLLGGQVLRDFSLALFIGIVFGTYSSIYIASPVMMMLYRQKIS
jgi:preprotein translocase subunit SecF